MQLFFSRERLMKACNAGPAAAAFGLCAWLAGCSSVGLGGSNDPAPAPTPRVEATIPPPSATVGQTFGAGHCHDPNTLALVRIAVATQRSDLHQETLKGLVRFDQLVKCD